MMDDQGILGLTGKFVHETTSESSISKLARVEGMVWEILVLANARMAIVI